MHKNFKNIDRVVYGRGSFQTMEGILASRRDVNDGFFLFVVDHYFKGKELEARIPLSGGDIIRFIDVDPHEPTWLEMRLDSFQPGHIGSGTDRQRTQG